jgi:transposase
MRRPSSPPLAPCIDGVILMLRSVENLGRLYPLRFPRSLTACLCCVQAHGQVTQDVREFATMYSTSLALTEWLAEQHCPVVAMESTGVYWQAVYHVPSGTIEVLVGNAQEMRRRPSHKTDKPDARWIAELLAQGLIRPSFVPPPPIQALRDLTRTRVALIQTRSQAKNRVHKVLEDTNIVRELPPSGLLKMAKVTLSRVISKTSEDSGRDDALQVRLLADRRRKALAPV